MAAEQSVDPLDLSQTSRSPKENSTDQPKTWDLLRQNVQEKRKLLVALVSNVPTSFSFRVIETPTGQKTRIYFLGTPQKCRENTLMYADLPNDIREVTPVLNCKSLLDSFQPSLPSAQLSREEQLMRERKRLGIFGITSYDIVENEGKFVFPACNSLFVCMDRDVTSEEPVLPLAINTSCCRARLDPKICPRNPNLISFIHSNDLWVTNLQTGQECRLTFAHKGLSRLSDDPMSAGVPCFVVQEEFDRYTGYWWEPKPKTSSSFSQNSCYRILYEEIDESGVEILNIFAPMTDTQGIDEYRYPRAGTDNAVTALKLVEFEVGSDGQIQDSMTEKELYEPLSTFFPWMEYLIRAGWTPDSKFVYVQIMNRQQTRLALVLIPLECFIPVNSDPDMELNYYYECTNNYPPLQVIYEDTSDIWINVHDILHFFPQEIPEEISFLWSTEQTGYRHLYKVTSKLLICDNPSPRSAMEVIENNNQGQLKADVAEQVALTCGEWEVQGKQIWVDEKRNLVYFLGHKHSVLETHLYAVSYSSPKEPYRLTELGYSHTISFSSELSVFVTVYSSVQQTPVSSVHRICHRDNGQIYTETVGIVMPSVACPEYHPPDLFSYKSVCGRTMHGLYYKPHDFQSGVKYPTVLMVYGGPQVQQVTNSFKGLRFLRHHTLASQGYAVVVIDGRGSSHRGLDFEAHIKNRLGTVEIDDQVEGLQWLASQVDFIDLERVAIHGWSYGGYLSLLGLAQRPDIFKVAIAGAPVVDWKLYDTGYTERYLDVPNDNSTGYQQGSVLHYIQNFPDEENRLLVIHGLIDENVHFQHTSTLINALVKACKPYSLQVYPNERHGIRNHEAAEHYKTMILSFLQNHL